MRTDVDPDVDISADAKGVRFMSGDILSDLNLRDRMMDGCEREGDDRGSVREIIRGGYFVSFCFVVVYSFWK